MLTGSKGKAQTRWTGWRAALIISCVLAVLRAGLLAVSDLELGADEAQYWFWGQNLAWGYYSKPPMIGWLIAASTSVLGDNAFGVRFFTPFFLTGTGLALYGAGRQLFGPRSGLVTLVVWHLMPAVLFGATLISTDVPLLFFWSLALLALVGWWQRPETETLRWAAALGVSLGLAFLSKYAAIYFLIGLALSLALIPDLRRRFGVRPLLVAALAFALAIAPNLIWNIRNGFQTLRHTADNADWNGFALHFDELGDFLAAQLFVFGPLLFLTLLVATFRPRVWRCPAHVFLLAFVLPALTIVSVQALLSRAHANWAMAAYPAAAVLIPQLITTPLWRRIVGAGTVLLHGTVALLIVYVTTDLHRADDLGLSNTFKRNRGWAETAAEVKAAAMPLDGLIIDDREVAAHLIWELRDWSFPIEVFDSNGRPDHTYDYEFGWQLDPQ
ncbi:MAG: glycosyltransferase family 39 protein, partial [Parvularcula sp.]|nr:glycosyltransferase family 39 protein [Parvularcula sp.]